MERRNNSGSRIVQKSLGAIQKHILQIYKQRINWLPVFHRLVPYMDSIQQLWFTTPTRTETMSNVWDQAISGQVIIQVPTNYSFHDLRHHRCKWNGAIVLSIWLITFASFHADGTLSRWRDNYDGAISDAPSLSNLAGMLLGPLSFDGFS